MKYKIGVNTNCGCGDTLEETLQNIKAAGFTHVQVAEEANANSKEEGSAARFEDSIKLALGMGFEIPFVHLAYKHICNTNDLWVEGEENEKVIDFWIERIKICGKHGIKVAVIHVTISSTPLTAISEQGIRSMEKLLKVARASNVKIALENLRAAHLAHTFYLLDNIKSPNLGFCYDAGHHNLHSKYTDFVTPYGERFFAVHLQDNLMDWTSPEIDRDRHLLPFDGKVDFEKVMRDIARTNYDGVVMLEVNRNHDTELNLYKDTSPTEFLREAKRRGERLAEMFERYSAE